MSWYTVVLDTVREVTQAISAITGTSVDLKSSALPYHTPKGYSSIPSKSSQSPGSAERYDSEDSDEEQSETTARPARVTTRARVTYELDRFRKNTMLMFVQIRSDPEVGCRVTDLTMQEVNELLITFTSFRFEVDVHLDMTCDQIDSKCQESERPPLLNIGPRTVHIKYRFRVFQRDFREYGAVMVVVLSFEGTNGYIAALDGRLPESVILRHLTTDLNPSLEGKPKIFITEANRSGAIGFGSHSYSSPVGEHQDVLGLHIPALYYGNSIRRPLLTLCDNVKQLADTQDFVTILNKTITDASDTYKLFKDIPIELNSTFRKEMILARC